MSCRLYPYDEYTYQSQPYPKDVALKFIPALAGALFALAAAIHSPDAAAYSQLIAFGDSLSDNGNLKALVGFPGSPYYEGRLSNGPVAVEIMASQLGLALTDYAYGGAQTGEGNVAGSFIKGTGIASQIEKFGDSLAASGQTADASALYFVWGGANDFFSGSAIRAQSTAPKAANRMGDNILSLYQLGARNFFVPLLPDLGLTPSALTQDESNIDYSAIATSGSVRFNSYLQDNLHDLQGALPGATILVFDTLSLFRTEIQLRAAQSFNVTEACYTGSSVFGGMVCSDPDRYMFWDGVHPTAVEHAVLGKAFAQAAAVPEPSEWLLLAAGVVSLLWVSARQRPLQRPAIATPRA